MIAFPDAMDQEARLRRRIRRALENRQAMHMSELSRVLGSAETALRGTVEAMMAQGEVERLRPLNYGGSDQDYFRLHTVSRYERPGSQCRRCVRQAREVIACGLLEEILSPA